MQRKHLLGTAAAAGLAFGLAAPAAQAFDTVNWTWTKTDTMSEVVDIVSYGEFYPTGIVEVEKIQVYIGDLNSTARLDRFENNQPSNGGGSTTLSGQITFEGETFDNVTIASNGGTPYSDDFDAPFSNNEDINASFGNGVDPGTTDIDSQIQTSGDLAGANVVVSGGISGEDIGVDEAGEDPGVKFVVDISGLEVEFEPEGSFDARTELPEVNVTATSAANVDQIESEVMTMVHSGQYAFGDVNEVRDTVSDADLPDSDNPFKALILAYIQNNPDGETNFADLAAALPESLATGNRHHDVLVALGALIALGYLEPAEINADASAGEIINASANIVATALSNSESISLIPDENWVPLLNDGNFADGDGETPQGTGRFPVLSDEKLVADITQFAYSNNTASAYLGFQSVNNYTNLRQLPAVGDAADVAGVTVPVTNVTASAIGNAANIKVGFGLGD